MGLSGTNLHHTSVGHYLNKHEHNAGLVASECAAILVQVNCPAIIYTDKLNSPLK